MEQQIGNYSMHDEDVLKADEYFNVYTGDILKKYKKNSINIPNAKYLKFLERYKRDEIKLQKQKELKKKRIIKKKARETGLKFEDKIFNSHTDKFVSKNTFLKKDGSLRKKYEKEGYELNKYGNIQKKNQIVTVSFQVTGYRNDDGKIKTRKETQRFVHPHSEQLLIKRTQTYNVQAKVDYEFIKGLENYTIGDNQYYIPKYIGDDPAYQNKFFTKLNDVMRSSLDEPSFEKWSYHTQGFDVIPKNESKDESAELETKENNDELNFFDIKHEEIFVGDADESVYVSIPMAGATVSNVSVSSSGGGGGILGGGFSDDREGGYNSRYLSYNTYIENNELKLDYHEKSEYIRENQIRGACLYNILIDTYRDSFLKLAKNPKLGKEIDLTYEYLWRMFNPQDENEEPREFIKNRTTMSLYINQILPFFQKFRLAVYCFSNTNKLIFKHDPRDYGKTLNKNINPQVLYLMLHNRHAVRLNNNLDSLKQIKDNLVENDFLINPSNEYKFAKKNAYDKREEMYIVANSFQDIQSIIQNNQSKIINVAYNNCLRQLIIDMKNRLKYEPTISVKNHVIKTVYVENINKNTIRIENVSVDDSHIEIQKSEHYQKLNYHFQKIKDAIISQKYLSTYNEKTQNMLNFIKSPPTSILVDPEILVEKQIEHAIFDELEDDYIVEIEEVATKCSQLDFNKYYLSIFLDLVKYGIPTINEFDHFIDYDNHTIEDMNIYYVEKLNNEISYPYNKYNLCFGVNIKQIEQNSIKIISYIRPSKLIPISDNIFRDLYDEKEEDLEMSLKKWIVNCILGLASKKYNSSSKSILTTNIDEAIYHQSKYGGGIIKLSEESRKKSKKNNNNNDLYLYYNSKSCQLESSFQLIQAWIYDCAGFKLDMLVNNLKKHDLQALGIKTDCVYYKHDNENFKNFYNEFKDIYFNYTDKNSFESIGKLKLIKDIEFPLQLRYMYEPKNLEDNYVPYTPEINNIHIDNEWDTDSIIEKIKEIKHIKIDGVAGSGKSFICKKICDNDKTLFIYPYNNLRQLSQIRGNKHCCSSHKIFNLLAGGMEKESRKTEIDIDQYDCLIFEEINLEDTYVLSAINKLCKKYKDKIIISNGDYRQLETVGRCNNNITKNYNEYINDAINSIFPNKIYLKQNKRCNTTEDRERVNILYDRLFDNFNNESEFRNIISSNFKKIYDKKNLPMINICYTNQYAQQLNKYIHHEILKHKEEYFVGLKLVCKIAKNVQYDDIISETKTEETNSNNKKTFKINSNMEYIITAINKNMITISDQIEDEYTLNKEFIKKHFGYSYCRTAHSYQGESIDRPYCVHESDFFHTSTNWLYVCISRTTDPNFCSFFHGNHIYNQVEENIIEERIQQHYKNDKDKNIGSINTSNYKPLTVEYIKQKLFDCKMKCTICMRNLDINNLLYFSSWSIDRINNNECHQIGNIQIVCRHCNVSKH
jgi:hypothetical protein